MACEYCFEEHDGRYGSGRFCDRACASGFSTSRNREEISAKASKALKGRPLSSPRKGKKGPNEGLRVYYAKKRSVDLLKWKEGLFSPSDDRCKSMLIQERGAWCERCGWAETNPFSKTIPIELEHVDGDCYNNAYQNLSLLCPNCHSLTPTFRGLNARKGRGRKMYKLVSEWAKSKK